MAAERIGDIGRLWATRYRCGWTVYARGTARFRGPDPGIVAESVPEARARAILLRLDPSMRDRFSAVPS